MVEQCGTRRVPLQNRIVPDLRPLVERFHECDEVQSSRTAQAHKEAATAVVKTNHGSRAVLMPSAITREICVSVSRPKITPLVMTYAFII